MTRYFVLAFLLVAFLSVNAAAATLFGRVIEVNDGDVITVFNLNRPVRIKLLAVDAPEAGQAFGDVAKKHLSELVYDKSVSVEYWGIAADGSLVGRVTLNDADIGAQMIRDGAAWFDASNQDRLSAADRAIYRQSEQAARSERRGLWEAANPIAPWEFVRAKALKREPAPSLNSVLPAAKRAPDRPAAELTNLTLISARMNSAAVSSVPGTSSPIPTSSSVWDARPVGVPPDMDMTWATDFSQKQWRLFKPAGENFSAEVPGGGKQMKLPVAADGGTADLNLYMVRDGKTIYKLIWLTGPSYGEADEAALDQALGGYLKGIDQGYQSAGGRSFSCASQREQKLSLAGYAGSEYDLSSCIVPGKLRVFTKVIDGQRQMYVGAAFYPEPDPNVSRFLHSFTVSASTTPKPKRTH
jgi:endonuclease YncB( thermonuclease family)